MEKSEITFVDAQQMRLQYPDTFEAPNKEELDDIEPNDSVKVCVNDVERFWVTVTEIDGNVIKGTVDNYVTLVPLTIDEEIEFEKRHVYSIWKYK